MKLLMKLEKHLNWYSGTMMLQVYGYHLSKDRFYPLRDVANALIALTPAKREKWKDVEQRSWVLYANYPIALNSTYTVNGPSANQGFADREVRNMFIDCVTKYDKDLWTNHMMTETDANKRFFYTELLSILYEKGGK